MLYAVIMAGGSGTRFWPRSRRATPKQLLTIDGEKTMLRRTVERVLSMTRFERIMVVTGEQHADAVRSQLPESDDAMIVVEPFGRNTAPCLALAACKLKAVDPEAVMLVLPADHLIGNEDLFRGALAAGVETVSRHDALVTFGILPSRPETGFGYIRRGNPAITIQSHAVCRVEEFKEKPDRATAQQYLRSGDYLWNSGMFVWKARDFLTALDTHAREVSDICRRIEPFLGTVEEAHAIREAYEVCPSISVDYAVMEKADNVLCIAVDAAWNDVGSWASLDEVWERDPDGNAASGTVVCHESGNCVVYSPDKVTALIGMEDVIIVDTPDALLVCRKDRAQDVSKLTELLKSKGLHDLL